MIALLALSWRVDSLPQREWIRAEDAAAYLRVCRATVCAWIKARVLVGRQPKRRGTIYVSTASIRRALRMPEVSLSHDEAESIR
jgi:hypothetical protein